DKPMYLYTLTFTFKTKNGPVKEQRQFAYTPTAPAGERQQEVYKNNYAALLRPHLVLPARVGGSVGLKTGRARTVINFGTFTARLLRVVDSQRLRKGRYKVVVSIQPIELREQTKILNGEGKFQKVRVQRAWTQTLAVSVRG